MLRPPKKQKERERLRRSHAGKPPREVVLAPLLWGCPCLHPRQTAWVIMANRPDPKKPWKEGLPRRSMRCRRRREKEYLPK